MGINIKQILSTRSNQLEKSDKTLEDIFNITFSERDYILCEGNDGFRTYRHSYGTVYDRIVTVAGALYNKIGDTHGYVALACENSEEWVVGFWAILMSGNKPYLVNTRYPLRLTNSILKTLDIKYTLCVEKTGLETEEIDILSLKDGGLPSRHIFENELCFSSSATSMNEVVCFYTGKEISEQILNFKSIVKSNLSMTAHYKGQLKQLAFLPFYHIFGLFAVYFWFTFFGRTLVFLRDLSAQTILKTCKRHEVTHIFAVPALWHTVESNIRAKISKKDEKTQRKFEKALKISTRFPSMAPMLMKEIQSRLFGKSVRFCINGGSYIRESALSLINGVGYPLYNGYGMSEIGIASVELRKTPRERNEGAIGRPFDSVEYRIDENGVLQVKGKSLCVKKLVNGSEAVTGEWFDTGDMVTCRDGNYFINGRKSDTVIGENGENINPDMVESCFDFSSAFSVLGLGDGADETLSLVLQISPYATKSTVDSLIDRAYAKNGELDSATAVKRFYFTKDEIMPKNAIKVSRVQLKKRIASGEVTLIPFSQMKAEGAGDGSPLLNDVIGVIASVLNKNADEIKPDSHVFFDLGATSIQYFSLLSALSEKFEIGEYDKNEKYCYTPREICDFLERYL